MSTYTHTRQRKLQWQYGVNGELLAGGAKEIDRLLERGKAGWIGRSVLDLKLSLDFVDSSKFTEDQDKEFSLLFWQCFTRLRPQVRIAWWLIKVEGLSQEQTALIMGEHDVAIRNLLAKGNELLPVLMEQPQALRKRQREELWGNEV